LPKPKNKPVGAPALSPLGGSDSLLTTSKRKKQTASDDTESVTLRYPGDSLKPESGRLTGDLSLELTASREVTVNPRGKSGKSQSVEIPHTPKTGPTGLSPVIEPKLTGLQATDIGVRIGERPATSTIPKVDLTFDIPTVETGLLRTPLSTPQPRIPTRKLPKLGVPSIPGFGGGGFTVSNPARGDGFVGIKSKSVVNPLAPSFNILEEGDPVKLPTIEDIFGGGKKGKRKKKGDDIFGGLL
jgi:hypothetical protein